MNPNTVQINAAALTKLQSWQERSETMTDVITAAPRLTTGESHLAADPIGACDRLARAIENLKSKYGLK
jgi:3-methylfumaryl-CoA hydratase